MRWLGFLVALLAPFGEATSWRPWRRDSQENQDSKSQTVKKQSSVYVSHLETKRRFGLSFHSDENESEEEEPSNGKKKKGYYGYSTEPVQEHRSLFGFRGSRPHSDPWKSV